MKKFYEIALTEYRNGFGVMEGSYFLNILLSCAFMALYLLMIGVYIPFRKKVEIRHFGFLLGNLVYLIAICLGFSNRGFLYTLGSLSSELSGRITGIRKIHVHLFIFSSIFIYSFYVLLLSSHLFYFSSTFSVVLACCAVSAYCKVPDVYLIALSLAQAVLLSLLVYSVYMLAIYSTPSMQYIEDVSLLLIGGIFVCSLMQCIRKRWKKHF